MNAKVCLASLLALGSAVAVGCSHHHADAQLDQNTAPVVSDTSAGGGNVDTKAVVETKVANPGPTTLPAVPSAEHVSSGADLAKPDAPALPPVPPTPPVVDTLKPDAPKVPDAPKPDAPAVPDPSVKPEAPAKPDAPAVPDPTVKPDAPAPDQAKPDAAKATDAAKSAIEKEVGTEDAAKDAAKTPDAGK